MTAGSGNMTEEKPDPWTIDAASKIIAIFYAILVIPTIFLAAIGVRTVSELGSQFNSWGVYWLCVGNYPITFFFTALVMWGLRRRKQFAAALAVALIPVVILTISFLFGYL